MTNNIRSPLCRFRRIWFAPESIVATSPRNGYQSRVVRTALSGAAVVLGGAGVFAATSARTAVPVKLALAIATNQPARTNERDATPLLMCFIDLGVMNCFHL